MVTPAALAMYLVELLKEAVRALAKNPMYEFPPKLMAALLVVANAVAQLMLAFLDVEGYDFPVDWLAWAKTLVLAILGAVVSSALYVVGYVPFKLYAQDFYARVQAKSKARKAK